MDEVHLSRYEGTVLTIQLPGVPGTQLMDLGQMKG